MTSKRFEKLAIFIKQEHSTVGKITVHSTRKIFGSIMGDIKINRESERKGNIPGGKKQIKEMWKIEDIMKIEN